MNVIGVKKTLFITWPTLYGTRIGALSRLLTKSSSADLLRSSIMIMALEGRTVREDSEFAEESSELNC